MSAKVVITSIIHWRLEGPKKVERLPKQIDSSKTNHASEPLLACGVPQLETYFDTVNIHLLGNKESAARGGRILWVELVLGIPVQETGLADSYCWKRR